MGPSAPKPGFLLEHAPVPKAASTVSLSSPQSACRHCSWWACCHILRLTLFLCSGTGPISLWQGEAVKDAINRFQAIIMGPRPITSTLNPGMLPPPAHGFWGPASRHGENLVLPPEGRAEPWGALGGSAPLQACVCGLMQSEHSPSTQGRRLSPQEQNKRPFQ